MLSQDESYWQLFDKLIKTKLRSSPTFGAWSLCYRACRKRAATPRPEGAIFKLDLTWWRAAIWIRANQFKFVRNSAPFLARLWERLVGCKWKRIKSKAAKAAVPEINSLFNSRPKHFEPDCFSNFSIPTPTTAAILLQYEGMSGTIQSQAGNP